jgi:hypothetical protein
MSTSSARQSELGGLGTTASVTTGDNGVALLSEDVPSRVSPIATSTTLNVPEFGARGAVYAVTARLAGRMNAASISEEEHNALLEERQRLLDRMFAETLTRRESNRLQYVRWSLDRIEDAKHGPALDVLEDAVSMYERFVSDVADLREQLIQRTRRRRSS